MSASEIKKLSNIFIVAMFALCALLFTAVVVEMAKFKSSHPDFIPSAWVSDPTMTQQVLESLVPIMYIVLLVFALTIIVMGYIKMGIPKENGNTKSKFTSLLLLLIFNIGVFDAITAAAITEKLPSLSNSALLIMIIESLRNVFAAQAFALLFLGTVVFIDNYVLCWKSEREKE